MIKHYEVYIKVVELGSFSNAARDLYLSQPTVTASVKALEKELDVSLIDRSYKKLTLTEAGQITYDHAKRIVEGSSKLKNALRVASNSLEGNITLSSSTFGKAYVLERAIPSFLKEYPSLSLTIDIQSSINIIDAIKANDISFGIVGDANDKSLNYQLLATHGLVLLTPKNALSGKQEISITELKKMPLIKRGDRSSTFKSFNNAIRDLNHHPDDFNYILEVDDLEFIKRMVFRGVGYSIVNDSSIRDVELKQFDLIKISGLKSERNFYIATSKKHPLSYAEQKLLNHLLKYKQKKAQ